jgi:hypothetical protein
VQVHPSPNGRPVIGGKLGRSYLAIVFFLLLCVVLGLFGCKEALDAGLYFGGKQGD